MRKLGIYIVVVVVVVVVIVFKLSQDSNRYYSHELSDSHERNVQYMPSLVVPDIPNDSVGVDIIETVKNIYKIESRISEHSKAMSNSLKELRSVGLERLDEFESDYDYNERLRLFVSKIDFENYDGGLSRELQGLLDEQMKKIFIDNKASIELGSYDANNGCWEVSSFHSDYVSSDYDYDLGCLSVSNVDARKINKNGYDAYAELVVDIDRNIRVKSINILDKVTGNVFSKTFQKIWRFYGGRDDGDIAFSPDGRWIISGGSLFDLYAGEEVGYGLGGVNSDYMTGNFSPCGQYVAVPGLTHEWEVGRGYGSCQIDVYHLGSGLPVLNKRLYPGDTCWEVAFSVDGGVIAFTSAASDREYGIGLFDSGSKLVYQSDGRAALSIFKENRRLMSSSVYYRGHDRYISRKECCDVKVANNENSDDTSIYRNKISSSGASSVKDSVLDDINYSYFDKDGNFRNSRVDYFDNPTGELYWGDTRSLGKILSDDNWYFDDE